MDWLSKYIPTDAADVIPRAARFFEEHDFLWRLPCVFALSDDVSTHSVVWDELCVRRLLPMCSSPNREALISDLETLIAMRARLASENEFGSTSRVIWYRNSSRDEFQTAVAQLFGIVGHELHPNGKRPLAHYGVGVALIAEGERFAEWVLSVAIEEFTAVEQKRRIGMLPSQVLNLEGADHYGFKRRRDD